LILETSNVQQFQSLCARLSEPARVSFVSHQAQFTPKSVKTANERQKLMFRIKARIDGAFLQRHQDTLKSGMPGVAWVKTDALVDWPHALQVRE